MPFSLEQWKTQRAANSTYFALAGMALFPAAQALTQAMTNRDPAALGQLYLLGASIGGSLFANLLQDWANESDAVAALNVVSTKLEALPTMQHQRADADQMWFEQTLQAEPQRLGSNPHTLAPMA